MCPLFIFNPLVIDTGTHYHGNKKEEKGFLNLIKKYYVIKIVPIVFSASFFHEKNFSSCFLIAGNSRVEHIFCDA